MKLLLLFLCAAAAYLVGGVNPAIILSRALYKTDIRRFGSHNPGFTNFMRIFGQNAWLVFACDFAKSILLCILEGLLFRRMYGSFQLGAAYACLFAILGHAYPVWYGFHGGKGVAVLGASIWLIDWRASLVGYGVLILLLALKGYMSLGVIIGLIMAWLTLLLLGVDSVWVLILCGIAVLFIIGRHWENIRRLRAGTESKFSLKNK